MGWSTYAKKKPAAASLQKRHQLLVAIPIDCCICCFFSPQKNQQLKTKQQNNIKQLKPLLLSRCLGFVPGPTSVALRRSGLAAPAARGAARRGHGGLATGGGALESEKVVMKRKNKMLKKKKTIVLWCFCAVYPVYSKYVVEVYRFFSVLVGFIVVL